MPKPKNPIKLEDIKLGSDEMVFWKKIIDVQEKEVGDMEKSLRFSNWLVEKAKVEYEKAEKQFNEKLK